MNDYLTAFIGFFTSTEYQWLILFTSAFLSATLLPGNSEIVFTTLVSQALWKNGEDMPLQLLLLLASATLGNSLGSITTYFLARLAPEPQLHNLRSGKARWALTVSQRYGVWALLLSWLPVIGDLLCGIAGWLRFHFTMSVLCITLGKLARYLVILFGLYILLE
ncbi:DedA family protein [Muribacter muris]|uniref:DedA family protein n=1 Tax=Muribacter muris TaxID=67855 RepID=A0A4Y9K1G1_9PAST|nr:YqaA family protein [Muribacter muris]MBF0784931.1 DedA family protein [Muribacter muris]MBF0827239.1 DedA family protein [Muribacter muris]TFV10850.1 DedA family protein [Muribacter muris]